jgi:hypothetical protein
MTEEQVTKAILSWLKNNNWTIVAYDFPQSGTGKALHPNKNIYQNNKTKGIIIPDIIAVRNSICIVFENKNRFVLYDFNKINNFRTSNDYSESLTEITRQYSIQKYYFGIGLPHSSTTRKKIIINTKLTDFIIEVNTDFTIMIFYDAINVF